MKKKAERDSQDIKSLDEVVASCAEGIGRSSAATFLIYLAVMKYKQTSDTRHKRPLYDLFTQPVVEMCYVIDAAVKRSGNEEFAHFIPPVIVELVEFIDGLSVAFQSSEGELKFKGDYMSFFIRLLPDSPTFLYVTAKFLLQITDPMLKPAAEPQH